MLNHWNIIQCKILFNDNYKIQRDLLFCEWDRDFGHMREWDIHGHVTNQLQIPGDGQAFHGNVKIQPSPTQVHKVPLTILTKIKA